MEIFLFATATAALVSAYALAAFYMLRRRADRMRRLAALQRRGSPG